jgi:hypothetical protein
MDGVKLYLSQRHRGRREKKVNIFPPNPERARIPRDSQPARIIPPFRLDETTFSNDSLLADRRCKFALIADLSQSGQMQIKLLSAFSASLA